jgi:gliding motility-associated lipoprotein GldJ
MKNRVNLFVCIMCMAAIASCGGGKNAMQGVSRTTGWKYNDASSGGFEVRFGYRQPTAPNMVFIQGGTFTMGRISEDIAYDWNNEPHRVTVDSYYMDATEVRNLDYREYCHWLKLVYPSYPAVYYNALPDTLAWRKKMAYNEPLMEYYFRMSSFNDYPVVGVSWKQADEYCGWRTDRVNELSLVRAGILNLNVLEQKDADVFTTDAYVLGLYTGSVNKNLPDLTGRKPEGRTATIEDGIILPRFRLPTEAEWEYGAVGQVINPNTGQLDNKGPYPWHGNRVRYPTGQMMANFQKGRGDLMGLAGGIDGVAPTPMEVTSFEPNDFGLFCMAGNVNEWVLDIYRPLTFEDMEDFRPFRGNVFEEYAKNAEGQFYKDSLGRVVRKKVGRLKEGRDNYLLGDNRNFNDGDMMSLISTELDMSRQDSISNSNKMYNPGFGPKQQGKSTLITDVVRVYKGGSYKDRAYWLSPGTRRFLDETHTTDDLGFRCAMDRLGAAEEFIGKGSKKKR